MSSIINWLHHAWNSTELLSTYSYRLQLIAAGFTLLIFIITGLSAVLTKREDSLDLAAGFESAAAISSAAERAAAPNQRAGLAEMKAAEANEKAANANMAAAGMDEKARKYEAAAKTAALETAKIQSDNLEIQRSLERERTARLQIEERLAPRKMTEGQAQELVRGLAPLGPQTVDLVTYPNDPEIARFTDNIVNCFKGLGWSLTYSQSLGGGAVDGILVEYDPSDSLAKRRAEAIVSVLQKNFAIYQPNPLLPTPENDKPARVGDSNLNVSLRITIGVK